MNTIRIYSYSSVYYETKSDVAIVLGAGTDKGEVSPIFRERINHSILLYQKGIVEKIIFTGGLGKDQKQSDSKTAKIYAVKEGIPEVDILTEEKSTITLENLQFAKEIMDARNFHSALLISDPLHMKRAMLLSKHQGINGLASPTQTSMYRSHFTKFKQLLYESFYFSIRELLCLF